jgi:hypothetical protein
LEKKNRFWNPSFNKKKYVAHSLAQQAFLGPNQISMEETTPIILFVINQSFSNNIHYFCQQKKKKKLSGCP